jgi:hypothetical protein
MSLGLGRGTEGMNFAPAYSEERTSAVGPGGVQAVLTKDGIFEVSDELGNLLFFRRIKLEVKISKPSRQRSLATLKRRMSGKWLERKQSNSTSTSKFSLVSDNTSSLSSVGVIGEGVNFKCCDIGTPVVEDIVINKLLEETGITGQNRYAIEIQI